MSSIDSLSINTIRTLAIDAIQMANSGHPGLPLGAAPMTYVLWQNHLRHNPKNPSWPDRDRFVLSAGHGSMLLYAMLHLTGYDVSMDDIKAFRQWGSKTPGHPEFGLTPGVECTTGPLGQGCTNAVGMAMAEHYLASYFNRPNYALVDHYTYALVGDGDLMEGISAEAASLAGHLGLGKLIYLYDANDISLDGPTSLAFTEDVAKRYESYGWHVQTVKDGDQDLNEIDRAITTAKAESQRPSLIVVKTTIGYGSPNKAGSAAAHGAPLGDQEVADTKKALDWPIDAHFHVPQEAAEHLRSAINNGEDIEGNWQKQLEAYSQSYPELAETWRQAIAGELPPDWDADLPEWEPGTKVATRAASGSVLNAIAQKVPWFLGGDADLSCSTKTAIKDGGSFSANNGQGRNIHFGVREHAMGAIANGMCYHGGVRPYTATFFCFLDYMKPSVRLAALNRLPTIHVFTHDSIGLGEDGPTHQPIEHLASLRCMPNTLVIRPCDARETRVAWQVAMMHRDGPTALVLSRQGLPTLDPHQCAAADGLRQGAYILKDAPNVEAAAIILATGSEIPLALEAQTALTQENIHVRVVSMPSWELFAAQPQSYQDEVLPPSIAARVVIEAGSSFGWERYAGTSGAIIAVDKFGTSAPANEIFANYGFTVENVISKVREQLQS